MKKLLMIPFLLLCLPANADQALFQAKACVACHTLENRLVGPALKDIAARYAGTEGAAATLASNIKNGSAGTWGDLPMPPSSVSDAEASTLAEWILGL
ncbi:c-type cytochrome [Stutzerimonas kirkiae]|uniref:Cytochrome c-551 n=1 Tax=Stutzerimonas kirkiae TaxID=2211392 RepID=A0A4Q9RDC4_9GAMM|nr:c-type cytochrome [Stutzerimonas kirkiae]TBU97931.1 cytochrome C biogenesis protein CcsA [Stutzerimonas kirkiae]TBV04553.1 cytochrome C biogenesis protein CcsA [Stutzerimonas kirkiae]TBV11589.1 cytochrome C biogenesis protein CcsA [Stutzerimonas kirkiae]TBV16109.1 cytochrome C biogenesis protein CcsA [Stutzerimonas kirkiae]